MDKKEFSQIRQHLGKTQKQMAQLLGTSPKAIQSFEQGWRSVPVHIERQVLFLTALEYSQKKMARMETGCLNLSGYIPRGLPRKRGPGLALGFIPLIITSAPLDTFTGLCDER